MTIYFFICLEKFSPHGNRIFDRRLTSNCVLSFLMHRLLETYLVLEEYASLVKFSRSDLVGAETIQLLFR